MCLFVVLVALSPRLALLFLWLFTNYVDRAFDNGLVPVVGLLFLPMTTIMYALVWDPAGMTGGEWLWVFLGLAIDVTITGGLPGARRRRARRDGY